jgi:monoamine oxidase
VIKINFQFENNFWEEESSHKMNDAGFIFSDAIIPTWWTQHPVKNGQLTGWLAGPKAEHLKNEEEGKILEKALDTLAYIFNVSRDFIQKKLIAYHITNWAAEVFSCGAYSYATLDNDWAKKKLSEPLEQTLFFSGEALYAGTQTGTVEAALSNGIEVAREMIVNGVL